MFDADAIDDAYEKAPKEGIAGLPDGKYELEVTAAETKELANGAAIFHRKAVVLGGASDGHQISWDLFLATKDGPRMENVKQVRKELTDLGFDADDWTRQNGRPFWAELKKACAAMVGMRFKATKKAKESGDKVYQNLYVDERLSTDGKPQKIGAEELAEAAKQSIPF